MNRIYLCVGLGLGVLAAIACSSGSMQISEDDDDQDEDTDTDVDTDSTTFTEIPAVPETCEQAEAVITSVGCAFYAVDLDHWDSLTDPSDILPYAVVVSNPQQDTVAEIWIEDMRGPGGTLRTVPGTQMLLAPYQLNVFELTCASGCPETTSHVNHTGIGPLAAFRVMSDLPVLAYQWNTYGSGQESTDASLLLPTTSLGEEYVVASWGFSSPIAHSRSEFTVVAVQDGTEVVVTPSVATMAGSSVPALGAGVTSLPIVLDAFDVLQLAVAVENDDLTGSLVEATAPVAVFGSHTCAHTPTDEFRACDHIEEQVLPLRSWGTESVLARYAPREALTAEIDETLWRVIAGADQMTVTFDPPVPDYDATASFVKRGDYIDFISPEDHLAQGVLDNPPDPLHPEAPFLAYQLMTGRCYVSANPEPPCGYQLGDPMMVISPPAGQYLDRYVFATEAKFDYDYDQIIVVRPLGAEVEVDCLGLLPDSSFDSVGTSEWEVGRFDLDTPAGVVGCNDGTHWLEASEPVGLLVVGVSFANSYGYLAGTGLRSINPVIE